MKNIKFLTVYSLVVALMACFGTLLIVFTINKFFEPGKDQVTTDVVIDRVSEQSFLVTRTVYTDQEVKIDIDQGSKWSNFFWGKNITANGRVRTDMGVNLGGIDETDIDVDHGDKVITIKNTSTEVLDSSVDGEVEVEVGGSIVRRVLTNKDDKDYAQASEELIKAADRTVGEDESLQKDARRAAEKLLTSLFIEAGYKVEFED